MSWSEVLKECPECCELRRAANLLNNIKPDVRHKVAIEAAPIDKGVYDDDTISIERITVTCLYCGSRGMCLTEIGDGIVRQLKQFGFVN